MAAVAPLQEDVEFLEHFGVKGMRWGVRKERDSSGSDGSSEKKGLSNKQKAAVIAGSAVLVAAGALFVASKMRNSGNSSFGNPLQQAMINRGKQWAAVRKTEAKRVSDIRSGNAARKVGVSESHAAFVKAFKEKQTLLNRAANADLRAKDNELNVPIHLRSYLPDWT